MGDRQKSIGKIVILGGGSAGWIVANALVRRWGNDGVGITLVESPAIGTVGVGEGSTPRLKIFFDDIGVAESEWMPPCRATYKNGISFVDWSTRPGYKRYFHPFASQLDQHTKTAFYFNTHARRQGADVHAHPDRFFVAATLAENRQGPIPRENFPFVQEYGYHFDAGLLGDFLRQKAKERGVKHVQARVVAVHRTDSGDLASLQTDTDDTIEGDFFVDCSGFRASLIQETLETPFRSFNENLFNDSAVVLPTEQDADIGSQTVSTAMKHGWAWEIPLTHRIGNGYVYGSAFCSKDDAETELRAKLGLLDGNTEARHLKMKVGQVEKHWNRNCLAIGLSQGFVEPLEATALNVVCETVYDFIETVDAASPIDQAKKAFNDRATLRFEKIRDYIVAHYIMNTRDDTDYWRQNGANTHISDRLRQIVQIWKEGKSLSREIERLNIPTSYTAMSWYCLLAGYGFYPELRELPAGLSVAKQFDMEEVDDFIRRCAMNFRSQGELLRS